MTRTDTIVNAIARDLGIETTPGWEERESNAMPDPTHFACWKRFAVAYQRYNLRRKVDTEVATAAQMSAALTKWSETEARNAVVNSCGSWVSPVCPETRAALKRVFHRAKMHINRITSGFWPHLESSTTSGATSATPRRYSQGFTKLSGFDAVPWYPTNYKCLHGSEILLNEIFENEPAFRARIERGVGLDRLFSDVPPSILDFVPKDRKEVRLIVKGTALTVMVQKTIGNMLFRALQAEGIDLSNQKVNQEWARIGSYTGLVATVDESSASDSITPKLLRDFLTERLLALVAACTERSCTVKGSSYVHNLQMVAGMGNGFIFELQSLIFYAIARACAEETGCDPSWTSVYGDDIIVAAPAVQLLADSLLYYGISVNHNKTWDHGPFRESCGKHYFNGEDVTPFFCRYETYDTTSSLFHVYNQVYEWSRRTGVDMSKSLGVILRHISPKERYWVPSEFSISAGIYYTHDGSPLVLPKLRKGRHGHEAVHRGWFIEQRCADWRERWGGENLLIAWFAMTSEPVHPSIHGINLPRIVRVPSGLFEEKTVRFTVESPDAMPEG